MNIDLDDIHVPLGRIKVRALVKHGDEYLFIRRTRPGKRKPYLVFPGGRVKKSDRFENEKDNLSCTLRNALVRELEEELAARDIIVGEVLMISKIKEHDQEVLFSVEVGSYDWDKKTGHEFTDVNKGTYDLVKLTAFTKEILGKNGYRLKPKPMRKLIVTLYGS